MAIHVPAKWVYLITLGTRGLQVFEGKMQLHINMRGAFTNMFEHGQVTGHVTH